MKDLEHNDHWTEPLSMTNARDKTDIYCEFCGTKVPWHDNSCQLLKVAYKNRKAKCTWCDEVHPVGEQMFDHASSTHADEIEALVNRANEEPS